MFKLSHKKLTLVTINFIILLLASQVIDSNATGLVSFKLTRVVSINSKLVQMMDQDFGSIVSQSLKIGVFMVQDMLKVKPDFQKVIMILRLQCSKMVVVHQHMLNIKDQTPKTSGSSFMLIIEAKKSEYSTVQRNNI